MKKVNEICTSLTSLLKEILPSKELASQNLEKFPTYKFDKKKKSWVDVSNEASEIISNKTISFISYNVWFEESNWNNRLKNLFEILENYSADFICLQEVTEGFLRELINKEFIREKYHFSGNFKGSYDVLMLSKHNTKFYCKEFNSRMGRNLLITEINHSFDNQKFSKIFIATSHFESLNNAKLRKEQLETSFNLLNKSKNAFLMGDFNFDSSWKNEECNIDKNFKDCWFESRDKNNLNDEDRYTMPKTDQFSAWRPDRILFEDENLFELDFFEIIGKDPIEQDNPNNFVKTPSDHYGLFAMFNVKC